MPPDPLKVRLGIHAASRAGEGATEADYGVLVRADKDSSINVEGTDAIPIREQPVDQRHFPPRAKCLLERSAQACREAGLRHV